MTGRTNSVSDRMRYGPINLSGPSVSIWVMTNVIVTQGLLKSNLLVRRFMWTFVPNSEKYPPGIPEILPWPGWDTWVTVAFSFTTPNDINSLQKLSGRLLQHSSASSTILSKNYDDMMNRRPQIWDLCIWPTQMQLLYSRLPIHGIRFLVAQVGSTYSHNDFDLSALKMLTWNH